eukprot:XP_011426554.1 PREDICTED: tripartite motif-containing protein 45 [Crassostrea gigas]
MALSESLKATDEFFLKLEVSHFKQMEAEDQKPISDVDEISSLPDGDPKICNTCVKDPDTTAVLNCDESEEHSSEISTVNLWNLKKCREHQLLNVKTPQKRPSSYPSTKNIDMDDLILRHISEEMDLKSVLFGRLLQRCEEVSNETTKVSEDLTQEINSYFDNYIKAVESHRSQLIQQVRDQSIKQTDYIQGQKSVLSKLQQNVDEAKEFLNTITQDSLDESSHWKQLSKLLLHIRRANVHVRSQEMTFCPEADGPVIDQYQFYGRIVTGRVCPSKCFLNQEGLQTARVRHKASVPLHVVQEEGKPYPCSVSVGVKILEPSGAICKPKEMVNNMDGTWLIEIVPRETGKHELYVTVDGRPIKTKSVLFHVKPSWREHTGRWHCCSGCSRSIGNNEACIYGSSFDDHEYCSHLSATHPGAEHWTCCGKVTRHSECDVAHREKRLSHFGTRLFSRPRPLSSCSVDLRRIHSTIKEVTL